ncbi:MAG TPA: SOS response-associated peptidase family protein [Burkholderiaceae bacterium]|nr:SOS response-associated peptidase family protein [Burkholderiaceae bacterium]
MCTRYISPDAAAIERHWHIGRDDAWRGDDLFPRSLGPFIRVARDISEPERELVIGQWGLVPWFAKTARLAFATANARFEEVTRKPSFKEAWRRGRRCVIPALSFDEPNWESGRNVWWRFRRADGAPWGLAGLWNSWTDEATGRELESYTMLTVNADEHPLMRRMHKPDPRLPPERQDKRSVVAIELEDVDRWLHARTRDAAQLVRAPALELFDAALLSTESSAAQGARDHGHITIAVGALRTSDQEDLFR